MELNTLAVKELVQRALAEDLGSGDVTTQSLIPANATTIGFIYAKEDGVVAGIEVAKITFEILDPSLEFTQIKKDGDKVEKGTLIAQISGLARPILMGERVTLNFLQRMSGIATATAAWVDLVTYYNAKIVDTRKTAPGLRLVDKYAVRTGGGRNHRFGLYDAILIKDNHIKMAGGIQKAIALARQGAPHTMKVEVEVENLKGLEEALEGNADIIMLDNMDLETMREAVKITTGRALLEASGGVTLENLVEIAKTGVDLISVGSLTHSVKALDISLDVEEIKVGGGSQ